MSPVYISLTQQETYWRPRPALETALPTKVPLPRVPKSSERNRIKKSTRRSSTNTLRMTSHSRDVETIMHLLKAVHPQALDSLLRASPRHHALFSTDGRIMLTSHIHSLQQNDDSAQDQRQVKISTRWEEWGKAGKWL